MEIRSIGGGDALSGVTAQSRGGEEERLEKLRRQDREVRAHEQAHKAAAGGLARGGPSFEYERGPDGRLYAVAGEVNIDTSEVEGDANATVRKMQQVRRAALAPANPSSQDRQVAAEAQQKEREARAEAAEERTVESASEGSRTPYDAFTTPELRGSHVDLTL